MDPADFFEDEREFSEGVEDAGPEADTSITMEGAVGEAGGGLLSQVVVEGPMPGDPVRPNSGATSKRKPQDPKGAFVKLKRMSPPTRPSRSPQGAGRRLSDVWMEGDVLHVPQTEPVARRGTRGRAPQGSLSLDSLHSLL